MQKRVTKIKKLFLSFCREEKADLYAGMGLGILILLIVFMSCVFIFPLYTTYQALRTEARQLVSVAEDAGRVGPEVDTARIKLESASGVVPDSVTWSADWHNASARSIQLGDLFTVRLEKIHRIPIFTPAWSKTSYGVDVNLVATSSGVSEVYYKP
jgi:hypothetical protein